MQGVEIDDVQVDLAAGVLFQFIVDLLHRLEGGIADGQNSHRRPPRTESAA